MIIDSMKKPLADKIADILRQEIITHALIDGTHLNETTLAQRFDVSRGPVREALSILSRDGLVLIPKNGRATVVGFNITDIEDFYEIRAEIEASICKHIVAKPDNGSYHAWIDEISEMIDRCEKFANDGNRELYFNQDLKFHKALAEFSDSKMCIQIIQMISNLMQCLMLLNLQLFKGDINQFLHQFQEGHRNIIKGLKNHDAEFAAHHMQAHYKHAILYYQKIIAEAQSNNKAGNNIL